MKKNIILTFSMIITLLATGCSNNSNTANTKPNNTKTEAENTAKDSLSNDFNRVGDSLYDGMRDIKNDVGSYYNNGQYNNGLTNDYSNNYNDNSYNASPYQNYNNQDTLNNNGLANSNTYNNRNTSNY